MAPSRKKKGKKESRTSAPAMPVFEPAIERSVVLNQEAMGKVRPALAADFNEWGAMVA